AALESLAWLDERIPTGVFRGGLAVRVGRGVAVDLRDVVVELEASRLRVDGGVEVHDGVSLRELDVSASPLSVARLEPWLGRGLPVDGWLSGRITLSGSPEALSTDGRLTLVPIGYGGLPTTADFAGTVHLGDDPGVSAFHALVDPLSTELLARIAPSLGLEGAGTLRVDASGRIEEGIRFTADATHGGGPPDGSHVLLGGSARRGFGGRWVTDVQADLAPLSLELVGGLAPGLGLRGAISGAARLRGPIDSLRVTGELTVGRGTLQADATVDLLDPARSYALDVRVESVSLGDVVAALPEPSEWTGRVEARGSGLALDSLDATGRLTGVRSRIGGLHVDSVDAALTVRQGRLTVDTIDASVGGVHVSGSGELGLGGEVEGTARLTFGTTSLLGLRPIFRGDSVLARDELGVLEAALLRAQGVDPDTLPLAEEVAMDGRASGFVELSGSLARLGVSGEATLLEVRYGRDRVDSVEVRVQATDATSPERTAELRVGAVGLDVRGRVFQGLEADLVLEGRTGAGTVAVARNEAERYEAAGSFTLDSVGGEARVEEAIFDIDALPWVLARPAIVRWAPGRLTLEDIELTRTGEDPMRLIAEGTLDRSGSSDLTVQARGLHLERLARLAQLGDSVLVGVLELDLSVSGPAADPRILGSFDVVEPAYGPLRLSRLSGELDYAERTAAVRVDALHEDRRVFEASGTVPVDLALAPVGERVVARSMDVRVRADSLDAAVALSTLDFLQNVGGAVSGDFQIAGPLDRPEPSGVLRLDGASWEIEALGVAHDGIEGTLTLRSEGVVEVELIGHAGEGTSAITGTVTLDPPVNPRLDLQLRFADFEALARRDVAGHISGTLYVDSTYAKPLVTGQLTVDHATLFLEEFARSAEVVDLSDPRLYDWGIVDTTALSTRPLLAGIRNPFFDNLRVDVDLAVPRDTWLRSQDMNVEIGGQLFVTYDRLQRDLVLVGDLEALRGQYFVLSRRFEVQEGTVGFIGTPGINPTLDIQAVARIRRPETEPLEVNATVSGTLAQPRVTLSSDEQGLAESDLISYLIFGQPSLLTGGQEALVAGGAAGSLLRSTVGAGATYVTGALANQIGSAVAQEIGIDYLAFTPTAQPGVVGLAGSQIEVGRYVGENLFLVLIVSPPTEENRTRLGARVEMALSDEVGVQGFWEDRYLRSRVSGFGNLGAEAATVVGVFIFREWGY
ncbi:MAG TPA: translocation/assembly module TamB domain-containing protein, partial [Longimicrobiales bacterium]|nr:translocation/assembly module TamB domain-containing protein [Longimicrobiales bacterium]